MKQKVLITGASGFVGFHLIQAALHKGLDVYAAIRKSSDIKHLAPFELHYTYPDFNSKESLITDLRQNQYDFIIHAAGTTKAKNQEEYNKVNAQYTINLAQAIVESGIELKKMVFISSLAAIGPLAETGNFINEQTFPSPVTAYGKSKLLAEQELSKLNIPLIVLRPTAVYGERDKDIFIILKTFSQGLEPYIGNKAQELSFVYVKDLAQLTIDALFTGNETNGFYNVTDGKSYDRYEMANISKKVLNKKTLKFHLPMPVVRLLALVLEKTYSFLDKTPALNREKLAELTATNWCCDIEKAKINLSFKPQHDLEKGLHATLNWYKENKWLS